VKEPSEKSVNLENFMLLFALAWAGGAVAYVPFLTILLPLRVVGLVGPSSVQLLGLITFCGAVAASLSNIAFGWLSDRTGRRLPWIAAGLGLTTALLLAVPLARTPTALIAVVVCWQLALNMMLGPLSALAADNVPAHRTGLLGGLMALSPAFGALSGVIVTLPGLAGADQRLDLVGLMVVACVIPLLLVARTNKRAPPQDNAGTGDRRPFPVVMWFARLLVQIAEAALFAYLLLYFRSLDSGVEESRIARLFSAVLAAAVPIAILAGRWADRVERPKRVLATCALCSGVGLLVMSAAVNVHQARMAYLGFGLATTVFLSLHSGQTLRVLPNPARRGRDLGLFNLTNTLPSIIMPALALAIVPQQGFPSLLRLLALLTFISALLLFWDRTAAGTSVSA
jgi:MFS family permease